MQTIVLATQKGGSGKSTLAIGLAVAAIQAGHTVRLIETDQQGTLRDLAAETGGEAYLNSNDVVGQFKKMLDTNSLYYAMAYYPHDETENKFRNIKVRVKNHPEYHVRTQRGYQLSKESKQEVATTPQQKLYQAMMAPLPLTTLGVTSSANFLERADDDAKVTLQVHFNGNLLEYASKDQKYVLNCEVAVAVLDRSGKTSNGIAETINAAFTPEQLEHVRVHYVKSIPEVLELALPHTPREEKQDEEEREKVLSAQVS